jgi:hypothetical protein
VEPHDYLSSLAHTEVVRIATSTRAYWTIEGTVQNGV